MPDWTSHPPRARRGLLASTLVALLVGPLALAQERTPPEGPDGSLEPMEYVRRGLPATDRAWNAADYQAAAKVIAALPIDELPWSGSARSRAVLDRACSEENLGPASNLKFDAQTRMQLGAEMLQGVQRLLLLYMNASKARPELFFEAARLCGFSLRCMAGVVETAGELMAQLDPEDPTMEARRQGLGRMRAGLAQMLGGTLTVLEAPDASAATRLEIARALGDVFRRVAPFLPPESASEFAGRLERRRAAETDARVVAELDRALLP